MSETYRDGRRHWPGRKSTSDRLDVVRTDVLLWALGAFAEEGEAMGAVGYTPEQISELAQLARRPHAAFGEIEHLARKIGHPAGSVRTTITKMRRGPLPRHHEIKLRDLGLSVPALDRMDAARALASRPAPRYFELY